MRALTREGETGNQRRQQSGKFASVRNRLEGTRKNATIAVVSETSPSMEKADRYIQSRYSQNVRKLAALYLGKTFVVSADKQRRNRPREQRQLHSVSVCGPQTDPC